MHLVRLKKTTRKDTARLTIGPYSSPQLVWTVGKYSLIHIAMKTCAYDEFVWMDASAMPTYSLTARVHFVLKSRAFAANSQFFIHTATSSY